MARKKVPLDEIRLGKEQEHDKTRYQQIQEERINRNFRRLAEDTDSMNSHLTDVDSRLSYIEDGNFDTPLNIIPRRAYATLSSAGWYRVLTYDSYHADRVLGDVAYRINITIFDWARQMHEISFVCLWGSIKWIDEKSVTTNTNFIDKIRYTQNGTYGYIDVHYTDSSSRKLSCHFDVKADYDSIQSEISANDFDAVADAPVGETVLTTYTFNVNTPFIVETGTKSGWRYRQWSDGRLECWSVVSVSCTLSTMATYYHRGSATVNLPFTFTNFEAIQCNSYTSTYWMSVSATTSSSITLSIYDVVNGTQTVWISFYIIGTIS